VNEPAAQGLVLFAHGARDARWAAPFEAVAERVREQAPGVPVRLAFLELMAPPLAEAAAELVAAGCTRVHVLPLFLGTGGHLRRDLPPLVQALAAAHPAVHFTLHAAAGEQPAVVEALAACALASLGAAGPAGPARGEGAEGPR
jgi:sirohydrochlorin cobaltochelatase